MHHALALREGDGVPVLLLGAQAVHGVEAEVFGVRNGGEEATGHRGRRTLKAGVDLCVPFRGVRGKALGEGRFIGFAGGLIESEFDDRDVGVGWSEVAVQFGLGEVEFNLVEGFKRVAEVDQDQVALVSELGKESGLCGGIGVFSFQFQERGSALGGDAVAVDLRGGAPGLPVETEELVEQCGAFKSERNGREIGQRKHLEILRIAFQSYQPLQAARNLAGAKARLLFGSVFRHD